MENGTLGVEGRVQQAYDLAADLNDVIRELAQDGVTTEVNGGHGGWNGGTDQTSHQTVDLRMYRAFADRRRIETQLPPIPYYKEGLPLLSDVPMGEQFRLHREKQGRSLRDIEEMTGISISTLSRIERGEDAMVSNVARYASVLGITTPLFAATILPEQAAG